MKGRITLLIALFSMLFYSSVFANPDYVKFTALKNGSGITVDIAYKPSTINLEYSIDNGNTWQTAIGSSAAFPVQIGLSNGEVALLRGTNPQGLNKVESSTNKYIKLKVSGEVEVSGDIMSLIDYSAKMVDIIPGEASFYHLFEGSTGLVSAKNLKLSAKYTSLNSYAGMFYAVNSLVEGPDMSFIESIEENACQKMFYNCKKLTKTCDMSNLVTVNTKGCGNMYQGCTGITFAHDLVAKYVEKESYNAMFIGCTALTVAPKICALEMRSGTCKQMFKGCTGLVSSPDLTAQLLDENCYESMFEDCSSLQKAPVLKATQLYYEYGNQKANYTSCYKWMFKNCTALREIEVYFSDWRNTDPMPTGVWIQYVTETTDAVFKCPCGLPELRGMNCYIPNKWQVECFNFYLFDVYTNDAVWEDDHTDYNNRAMKESEITGIPQAYKAKSRFLGWNTQPDGTGTMFSLEDLPDTTTTYYAIFESLVPEEPEVSCINYTDLAASNVRCDTSSLYVDPNNKVNNKWNNWVQNKLIDYGPRNRKSQHTTHHHPAEVDVRTDGKLHTSCPNGKPSVRLGNWDKKQRERIVYTYTVPTDGAKILLLYYAAVLENPSGHTLEEQPRFTLDLFEEGSGTIGTCFQFDYISGDIESDPLWHTERGNLCWKDWTINGISLEPYQGKTIQIQITTYDCKQGGHFGYAYFGLECSNGEMRTISCGGQQEFKAPDGFDYAWFEESAPGTILSHEQIFPLPQDKPGTYWCKVSNIEHPDEPECSFNLKAVVEERSAVAEYDTLPRIIEDKNNIFYVTNTSHTSTSTSEFPDSCAWTLRDSHGTVMAVSDEVSPTFILDENGTYELELITYLKGKDIECPSTPFVKTIEVGNKGKYLEVPSDTTLCADDELEIWKGHPLGTGVIKIDSDTYHDSVFTTTTPQDTTVYILHIKRQYPTQKPVEQDVILKGQTYTWRAQTFKVNTLETIHRYDTTYYPGTHCDSAYYELELTVTEHPMENTKDTICSGDAYTWVGHEGKYSNLQTEGIYLDTIVSGLGDSTFYRLDLKVTLPVTGTETITVCSNAFPFTWKGQVIATQADAVGKTFDTISLVTRCDSIVSLDLHVTDPVTGYDHLTKCENDFPFEWHGYTISTMADVAGKTFDTISLLTGCDSVAQLQVTMNPYQYGHEYITDYCLEDLPYMWHGIPCYTDGDYNDTIPQAIGCDSVITLHLTTIKCAKCPDLKAEITMQDTLCANATVLNFQLDMIKGDPLSYSCSISPDDPHHNFTSVVDQPIAMVSQQTLSVPFQRTDSLHYIHPDDYVVTIIIKGQTYNGTEICQQADTITHLLHVLYPSWIIVQRWEDVLALTNDRYNGGYTFSSIRWFHEGDTEELPARGEHNSYYYSKDQGRDRLQGNYWAELTRTNEDKSICTCRLTASDNPNTNTVINGNIHVSVRRKIVALNSSETGLYRLYDVCGRLLQSGYVAQIDMEQIIWNNATSGTYILHFISDGNTEQVRKIVIQ